MLTLSIEREAQLGRPIHAKSALILQGFLDVRLAADRSLMLHAGLMFEEFYGSVAARLAELVDLAGRFGSPDQEGGRHG